LRDAQELGWDATLAVLNAGEQWAGEDYRRNLGELDRASESFIVQVILPEHLRCLRLVGEPVGQS
jgi:hypothetical protein